MTSTTRSPIRLFGYSDIRLFPYSPIRLFGYSVIQFKQAFSLVELLVVIAIIGILAGIMLVSFGGGTESARAATCLSNMRNLAAACQTYGGETGRYPLAGSIEYMKIDESEGIARAKAVYHEVPGWISWASENKYKNKPTSHMASSSWMTSLYSSDNKTSWYCMTNGALWKYVSGNQKTYICPSHVIKHKKTPVRWSYLMNAYFGWDASEAAQSENFAHVQYGHLNRADRILLFGEIPFDGKVGSWQPDGSGSGQETDCVLQFDQNVQGSKVGSKGQSGASGSGKGNENIGFNHYSGKMTFANVVFADGHGEKLRLPKGGMSDTELRDLTAWLCTGEDISFNGKKYERMEN